MKYPMKHELFTLVSHRYFAVGMSERQGKEEAGR